MDNEKRNHSSEAFTESGECDDEVTLVFDDEQELFVSKNFLYYVSPVFKAMFKHDCTEKELRKVTLPGKKYQDFLEFLRCLHPNIQKAVEATNVMSICALADEYQSDLITNKCRETMAKWLQSELSSLQGGCTDERIAEATKTCLLILITAKRLQYECIVVDAINHIARFAYKSFTGIPLPPQSVYDYGLGKYVDRNKKTNTFLQECKTLYNGLPDEIKVTLLSKRLELCDDSKIR